MAHSFAEDNEPCLFDTAPDDYSTNFDLFDLGFTCPNLEGSDESTSHDTTSTEDTNYFGDHGLGSTEWARDFFANCPDVFPSIESTISTFPSSRLQPSTSKFTPPAPQIQRLVHRMRPEGVAISGAQLLALENKDMAPPTAFRHPPHISPPITPPVTPSTTRTQPTNSSTKDSRRMRRVEKKIGHSRSTSRSAQYRSGSPGAMSSNLQLHRRQKTAVPSPSFAEWTDRLRRLAVQSPQPGHGVPISPPPSAKIEQSETSTSGIAHGLGLDLADDIFGLSSSATTNSSTNSKRPSTDEIYSPTKGSSSWDLDAGIELFGIKPDPWDLSPQNLHLPSTNTEINGLSSIPQTNYDSITDTDFGSNQDSGLGICFGSEDYSSLLFGTTVEPLETSLSASAKLPSMAFNTPASDFGSPAISTSFSAPYTHQTPLSRKPTSHPLTQPLSISTSMTKPPSLHKQHRRTKSSSSSSTRPNQSSSTGPKVRSPRTPKAGSAGGLGFVNFTPEDRNRILTGVAPSGSSKTKARREKEALDRRRKLSEAARRLVSEAGGDVEVLDRELSE